MAGRARRFPSRSGTVNGFFVNTARQGARRAGPGRLTALPLPEFSRQHGGENRRRGPAFYCLAMELNGKIRPAAGSSWPHAWLVVLPRQGHHMWWRTKPHLRASPDSPPVRSGFGSGVKPGGRMTEDVSRRDTGLPAQGRAVARELSPSSPPLRGSAAPLVNGGACPIRSLCVELLANGAGEEHGVGRPALARSTALSSMPRALRCRERRAIGKRLKIPGTLRLTNRSHLARNRPLSPLGNQAEPDFFRQARSRPTWPLR